MQHKRGLLFKRPRFFVDSERKLKLLQQRVHKCDNCGYQTDRDVAAAQVVLLRGLAAVGHTVKMLSEGKHIGVPAN